jgi:hypothetical protein
MRLPLIIAPLPEISVGSCLVQGRDGSGWRTVEKTLTTEFSTAGEGVSADPVEGAGLTDPEGTGDDGSSGEPGEPAGAGAAITGFTAKKQRAANTGTRTAKGMGASNNRIIR